MVRSLVALALIAATAAPASAASYAARLASPTSGHLIAPDMSWDCGPDGCQGSTVESRPMVLCESLAKRVGKIEGFMVEGRSFTEAELETCNGAIRAKNRAFAAQ